MLSDRDKEVLAGLDDKLRQVRQAIRGVAEGYHTGLYLWGEGGIGKTHIVKDELNKMETGYILTNSRLTGRGLFDLLAEYPDSIHLFEDMEKMMGLPAMADLMRSALGVNVRKKIKKGKRIERPIVWQTAKGRLEACFTGGIILTMNAPLDNLPELRALKTRIAHFHLHPTNEELSAKMREIADKGYDHERGTLTPAQCGEVCEYVIDRLTESAKNYDLRILIHGFVERLQYEAESATKRNPVDWRHMIDSRITGKISNVVGRAQQIAAERVIALEIHKLNITTPDKVKMWGQKTGKSQAAYYRRLEGK